MRALASREKVLLALLVVVAVVVVIRFRGDGLGFGAIADDDAEWGEPLGEPPLVKMDLLARNADVYDPGGRNLFSYYVPPPPKRVTPPPPPPKRQGRTATKPPPKRDPIRTETRRGPPKPNFDYIGYIGPKDARIAVFADREQVFVARVGEHVQEQFRVKEFGYETVVLDYVSGSYQGQTTELKKKTK